jgi:hypothetical protein
MLERTQEQVDFPNWFSRLTTDYTSYDNWTTASFDKQTMAVKKNDSWKEKKGFR